MSRNLGTSKCCNWTVKLSDMRGKPVEFRRFGRYRPHIGCKVICPECGTIYFAWWREYDRYWADPARSNDDVLHFGDHMEPNHHKGQFAFQDLSGRWEQTGAFLIDLAYYENFYDDHDIDTEAMAEELGMLEEHVITDSGVHVFKNYHAICDTWEKTFPDRPMPVAGLDDPKHLCLDDAEDTQWIW